MKFINLIIISSLLLLSFSCTNNDPNTPPSNIKVVTAGMITNAMSNAIVGTFTCSNSEAVKRDVELKVNSWFGLPQNKDVQKGILGSVCSATVSAIIPMVFGSLTTLVAKPEWGCTGKNVGDVSAKLASMACSFIPL